MISISADIREIWRYMSLISFLDFIQTGEIRFSRADTFEDTQEGYVALEAMLNAVDSKSPDQFKEVLFLRNREYFISCWHLSSSESIAMWKIYGAASFSVSIVSNVEKVMSACRRHCSNFSILGVSGEVIYDNYLIDKKLNLKLSPIFAKDRALPALRDMSVLFMKAKAFSYEQEWRIALRNQGSDDLAVRVCVGKVEEFVDSIYVSPDAPDWMVSTITRLIDDKFGRNKIPVSRSPLAKHFKV